MSTRRAEMIKMINPAPDSGFDSGSSPELFNQHNDEGPMSRTAQYRKVMKPLLERKRRARINRCLDDLKDIMVGALQAEGESITKLEKADVLELTVRHLRKLKQQNALGLTPQATYAGRFKAGYAHCAHEVSKFVTTEDQQKLDVNVSTRLLSHLGGCIQALETMPPSVLSMVVPTTNPTNNYPQQSVSPLPKKRAFDYLDHGSSCTPPTKMIKIEETTSSENRNSSSSPTCNTEAWRPW